MNENKSNAFEHDGCILVVVSLYLHCVCVESCLPPVTDLALQRKSQEVVNQQRSRAANLTPIDKLKEKATAAAMKKQYNVFDYYRHSK